MSSGGLKFAPVAAVGIGFVLAIAAALTGGVGAIAVVAIVGALVFAVGKVGWESVGAYRAELNKRTQQKQKAEKAAAEQTARLRKNRLIEELGAENAALLESAEAAVRKVVASDAARAGWLGDVDFTADIAGITDGFRKSHELHKVAQQLSKLDKPSANDEKIVADAQRTAAELAATATNRVKLIQKCAEEAELVDQSLKQERKDAQTAEQRAELHAKLGSMLYGIEAVPTADLRNSAADSVIARVQGYREIKNQVQLARE